jgi:uncharacterized membrane protein
MYKIIGADGKEYGPVSAELLRQWMAEGRVNGQTMARAESATDWQPLSAFPEFAAISPTGIPPVASGSSGSAAGAVPEDVVLGRNYELDIGGCIARSWDLVKQNFWPVVAIFFLIWLITLAINQVVGLASRPAIKAMVLSHQISVSGIAVVFGTSLLGSPVYTLLMAGVVKYYLKLIRAERPTIGDAFAGFSPLAGQLILLGLVTGILNLIGLALCILPGVYLSVSWIFGVPLVIDRGMNFWDAMEFSRKVVGKHWFIIFAFTLVLGLLGICGGVACCVGIFATMPIAMVALLYAYEDLFSRQGP